MSGTAVIEVHGQLSSAVPFQLVDHTADLAIEATGATREDVLGQAALALTAVVTGRQTHTVRPVDELRFTIEAPDPESLVVAFLSELLWLLESKDMLWLGGGVTVTDEAEGMLRLTAAGNGVRYDANQHGRGVEVKAVTYHDLVFRREGTQWRLWVLLDI